jgi:hypothetical protein
MSERQDKKSVVNVQDWERRQTEEAGEGVVRSPKHPNLSMHHQVHRDIWITKAEDGGR